MSASERGQKQWAKRPGSDRPAWTPERPRCTGQNNHLDSVAVGPLDRDWAQLETMHVIWWEWYAQLLFDYLSDPCHEEESYCFTTEFKSSQWSKRHSLTAGRSLQGTDAAIIILNVTETQCQGRLSQGVRPSDPHRGSCRSGKARSQDRGKVAVAICIQ